MAEGAGRQPVDGQRRQLEQRTPEGRLLHDWPLDGGRARQILPRANGEVWPGMQEGLYRLRQRPEAAALERVQPVGGQPLSGAVHPRSPKTRATRRLGGGQLGLFRWQQDALRPVAEAPGEIWKLPIVMALLVGRNGTLWVDTAVSGLHRLRGFDGTQRARFERHQRVPRRGRPLRRQSASGQPGPHLEPDAGLRPAPAPHRPLRPRRGRPSAPTGSSAACACPTAACCSAAAPASCKWRRWLLQPRRAPPRWC
ncbi:MAG: hypothetical protein U1E77_17565 [Inhella sp.]